MNRGAWRRVMRMGREWNGRRDRRWEISNDRACFGKSPCYQLGFRSRPGNGTGGGGNVMACGSRGVLQGGGRNVAEFQQFALLPASVRHYAAPLSRTAISAQKPARPQYPDPNAPPEPDKPSRKINRAIVSRTVRLVNDDGLSHEILNRGDALRRAEYLDLDLVEVDGKQDPPVCKLMDFNKERFKERQRERDLKKKQSERRRLDDLKEVRFSTRTEPNDLELKAQMALRLLTRGHRVKLAIIPHGNDDLEPKGRELLERMVTLLKDSSKVETGPRMERQRAWVLVRPTSVGPNTKKREGSVKLEISRVSSTSDSDVEGVSD